MEDLNFFNLLGNGSMEIPDAESGSSIEYGETRCNSTLKKLKLKHGGSGLCSWHYVCSYDSDRFPRFKVEAELDDQGAFARSRCDEERIQGLVYFIRRPCPGDPCGRTDWVATSANTIRVGYVSQ